jgi:hypothetical protein
LKFPGFTQFLGSSRSEPDLDLLPPIPASPRLDLVPLRHRLQQANSLPTDELSPMAAHAILLIDQFQQADDPTEKLALLGHLFYATHASMAVIEPARPSWPAPSSEPMARRTRGHAVFGATPGLQQVQRRAVLREMFAMVAAKLAERFQTTVNVLPRFLEDRFGTELSSHGANTDHRMLQGGTAFFGGPAPKLAYLGQLDRSRYRVVLRQGRAFVLQGRHGVAEEVPLDTTRDAAHTYQTRHRARAWGFVLSITRELYVANHGLAADNHDEGMFFHSSYFSGHNVLSAGDCIFVDGRLHSITNLSGHYQPEPQSLVHVLELFRTHGVDIGPVLVGAIDSPRGEILRAWSHETVFAEEALTAPAFLASQRDWSRVTVQRQRSDTLVAFDKVASRRGWR